MGIDLVVLNCAQVKKMPKLEIPFPNLHTKLTEGLRAPTTSAPLRVGSSVALWLKIMTVIIRLHWPLSEMSEDFLRLWAPTQKLALSPYTFVGPTYDPSK
ncbi:hypothetical protein TNCV_1446681 [Trichonephila clavipes]|nr:hypothetical protein TNCV_1446681 [Trichonephila clavipes]